jgi:uncharacterized protein (DUF2126 family)/transglutaminase-like putative cysteine protease
MALQISVRHDTVYEYDRLIALGPQIVRLRPAPHTRSPILSYSLKIEPENHFINWQQDPFANYQARLVFPEKTKEFRVSVELIVDWKIFNPFDFFLDADSEYYPPKFDTDLKKDLTPYFFKKPSFPLLDEFLSQVPKNKMRTVDFLVTINRMVYEKIQYLVRMEPGVQTPEETMKKSSGSCRDSSYLLIEIFRHLGLPARFVSGYLIQLQPDQVLPGDSVQFHEDFLDLHAWCEVYISGAGWIGLDPTSGLLAGEGHIPLAASPDPISSAPISGSHDICEVRFDHKMQVSRLNQTPSIHKPYNLDTWEKIKSFGHEVEKKLQSDDVRLTMGGEPTFVSQFDRDSPEWNTESLGPTKRKFAIDLISQLSRKYGRGGFFHYGQGKWYPGEPLPRWAISLYWRKDKQPIWRYPELISTKEDTQVYSSQDAKVFAETLASNLGIHKKFSIPAYEDTLYYLWRERKLPINTDPFDSKLEDPIERSRLRRVFFNGLKSVSGYVLPLERFDNAWRSGPWFIHEDRLYLIPGDSPIGFRLPIDSLPWSTNHPNSNYPIDPYTPSPPLPKPSQIKTQIKESSSFYPPPIQDIPTPGQEFHHYPKTALCVETRNPNSSKTDSHLGCLYVFMPPLNRLEDYLELLNAVETTALDLGFKIIIEGYHPPRDPRLEVLQVTPDPGVLEVNVQPSQNWIELQENVEFLYESASKVGLSTEKFMIDGKHIGTGGGSHIVLGGLTPSDSPFLRNPELLTSMIRFWNHHPSLSYLFSGLFIGPTSQSPRVDEARNDQIYELEIALDQIENQIQKWGKCPPWMLDRLLRNILIDVTGNTHRTEFSIDKMYSPDQSSGRLGLLELRNFEMPPHYQMNLAQQVLIRALVSLFWKSPFKGYRKKELIRWNTTLHDRFMLPSYIQSDFKDVLEFLKSNGYPMEWDWFQPHFEFKFPLIAEYTYDHVSISVRSALEPWHVMGEESGSGGNVRYVDSSIERIELRINNDSVGRYEVAINGVIPTFQPFENSNDRIVGVRYKAWNPYSSLHPTIGVQAPLTFDLYDTWNKRSVRGFQYHVNHPGGMNYTSLPLNSFEAESRRQSRVIPWGASQHLTPIRTEPNTEFPFTLDLRRFA